MSPIESRTGSPGENSQIIQEIEDAFQLTPTQEPAPKLKDWYPNRQFPGEAPTPEERRAASSLFSDLCTLVETQIEDLGLVPTPQVIRSAYEDSIAQRTAQRREKGILTPFPAVDPQHLLGSANRYQAWFEERKIFEEENIQGLNEYIQITQLTRSLVSQAFQLDSSGGKMRHAPRF